MTCPSFCLCHSRRLFVQSTGVLALAPLVGLTQTATHEGVDVGRNSVFSHLVPADTIEQSAAQQYAQMLQQAASKHALGGKDHPQVQRLRAIAKRIIPHALGWNPRAKNWRWEVNLIGSKQINAFCMPGGKIAFYSGILDQLKLTNDEVATVMGHEVAHALREHARARMGKNAATGMGANLLSSVLGLGQLGQTVTSYGAQLLTLQFSRSDESEADLVGMELAARAGFDPRAGVSLWQKMAAANKGAPPQWLSTHPSGNTRIADIQANLPKVLPLYQRAGAAISQ
ncbi:MAG: M48 family metallopeptidase [Rhodoferax sp.]|nr:M48 family metallopeptidase [Betaproteobacteria bacterium]NCN96150.1 M48 family metallopeptidase [Rhodoferax sp.]PIZ23583.1 MAG: peptidase M48 [Comamonadaceae bacterium CG_4_10_14_0_8_um_filter_57_29]PJC17923.1 MAG: peptidase M48 [Comamonadaceae bacterium CG_4_9_14_0_8_um_filter_57_21]